MLEAIGGLALVALAFYLFSNHLDQKSKKEETNRELSRYSPGLQKNEKEAQGIHALNKTREKYFSDPENVKKAVNAMNETEIKRQEDEERFKKEYIQNRVYGYEYEEEVFDIFIDGKAITKNELVKKIKDKLGLDYADAVIIIEEWQEHELIKNPSFKYPNAYELGRTLTTWANVVSLKDLSLGKYREQKGYFEKKEKQDENYIKDIEEKYNASLEDKYNDGSKGTLLNTLKQYSLENYKWRVSSIHNLEKYKIENFKQAEVILRNKKKMICIVKTNGKSKYYPLVLNSKLTLGTPINLKSLREITLSREIDDEDLIVMDADAL